MWNKGTKVKGGLWLQKQKKGNEQKNPSTIREIQEKSDKRETQTEKIKKIDISLKKGKLTRKKLFKVNRGNL